MIYNLQIIIFKLHHIKIFYLILKHRYLYKCKMFYFWRPTLIIIFMNILTMLKLIIIYNIYLTKLQKWSMWFAQNCHFGPKKFGLAPEVQSFHFVACLVQSVLIFLQNGGFAHATIFSYLFFWFSDFKKNKK